MVFKMNYKEVRKILEGLQQNNYKDLIKAIISMELNLDNEILIDEIYNNYMDNDDISLLSEEIINYDFKEVL